MRKFSFKEEGEEKSFPRWIFGGDASWTRDGIVIREYQSISYQQKCNFYTFCQKNFK